MYVLVASQIRNRLDHDRYLVHLPAAHYVQWLPWHHRHGPFGICLKLHDGAGCGIPEVRQCEGLGDAVSGDCVRLIRCGGSDFQQGHCGDCDGHLHAGGARRVPIRISLEENHRLTRGHSHRHGYRYKRNIRLSGTEVESCRHG